MKRIILSLLCIIFIASLGSAQLINESTGFSYVSSNSETYAQVNLTINSTNINILRIYKDSSSQVTNVTIKDIDDNILSYGNFVGDKAEMNNTGYTFLANTEYSIRFLCPSGSCTIFYTDSATLPTARDHVIFQQTTANPPGRYWALDKIELQESSGGGGGIPEFITLNSPVDDFTTSSLGDITFNATINTSLITDDAYLLINSTFYIWNSSGVYNQTLISYNGLSQFNETVIDIPVTDYGNYNWNVFSCGENITGTICDFSSNNFSFVVQQFTVDSTIFNESSYETSYEGFFINISTIEEILSVDARLIYNGSSYISDVSCSSGMCDIQNNIDVPLVSSGEEINYSFFWNISVFDGDSSISTTSDIFYQNISRIHLELCDATYNSRTLNFTSYLEKNLTRIDPFSFAGTFNYWLGHGTIKQNNSFQNTSTSGIDLCIKPSDKEYKLDSEIDYGFENENLTTVGRKYFFQNATISNTLQNIFLYLLEAEDVTTFILEVQDNTLQAVGDALINILRYYPGEGIYRVVQIAKTDENGRSVGFYETETVTYKHIITKDGQILLDTGGGGVVVGESVPFTLTFTVGDSLQSPWEILQSNDEISTSLEYNDTNNLVTFSYIDTTGASNFGRLLVYQNSLTNSSQRNICDTSTVGSSATIICNMTGQNGTFVAEGFVGTPTNLQKLITFVIGIAKDLFDKTGAFLGWMIILTVSMAALYNPSVGIILINSAIIFVGIIGLLVFSPTAYFSIIGISIILLILFKT